MKCPKCHHEQPSGKTECARCGLIFAKWRGDSDTASGGSGPSIQVTTVPISALFKTGWGGSVRITEDQKADVPQALEEGMAKSLPGYAGESREVVAVDRIPSVRVVGSALKVR